MKPSGQVLIRPPDAPSINHPESNISMFLSPSHSKHKSFAEFLHFPTGSHRPLRGHLPKRITHMRSVLRSADLTDCGQGGTYSTLVRARAAGCFAGGIEDFTRHPCTVVVGGCWCGGVTCSCQSTTSGFSRVGQERTSTSAHPQCHWSCARVCPTIVASKPLRKYNQQSNIENFRHGSQEYYRE